jgi:GNAT superfamily N-acetyltransferase
LEIIIREAQIKDDQEIAELSGQLGYPSLVSAIRVRLEILLGVDDQIVLVAESTSGEVIGWVHIFEAQRLVDAPFAEVGGLIVADGYQSGGIGAALLRAGEQWAQQRGIKVMRVRSNVVRERAHRFYERLGYEVLKSQRVFQKELI